MSERRMVSILVAKSLTNDAAGIRAIRYELARIAEAEGYILDGELRVGTEMEDGSGNSIELVAVDCYARPRDTP
jgi:hypothetical protein